MLISLSHVSRVHSLKSGEVRALDNVSLEVRRGSFVVVTGESGSGKSTLLNVVAGVDKATSGSVNIDGEDLSILGPKGLAHWRSRCCGVVLQSQQLIPVLTAVENIRLAMDLANVIPREKRSRRADELLDRVGLEALSDRFPDQLSGGQQQRVAIARALANEPPLIVADEPTAALDSESSLAVFELLESIVGPENTVVVSSHDEALAGRSDTRLVMIDGRLQR